MEKVDVIGRTVVKMWTTEIDDLAREQINNLAASAYKDIDQVIALEADLVKVKTKLEPIAVIKG